MQDTQSNRFVYRIRKNKVGQDNGLEADIGKELTTFDAAIQRVRFHIDEGYVTTIHRYDVGDEDGSSMKIVAILNRQDGVD